MASLTKANETVQQLATRCERLTAVPYSQMIRTANGWRLPDGMTISPDQRLILRQSADALDARMVPASPQAANRLLMLIVAAYQRSGDDADMAKARVQAFLVALSDLPEWAIADGVQKVLRGEAKGLKPAFCPSPAELRAVCAGEFYRLKGMAADLRRTADAEDGAPTFSDEHRAAMLAKLSSVVKREVAE